MSNTILLKRSAIANSVPSTGNLSLGELALNTYDGKLFTKIDNGTASVVDLTENQTVTLSGDVTGSGKTAITTTLANTAVTAGTYGNATTVAGFTVDSKGRLTGVTEYALDLSGEKISNGTSNVDIATSNGPVTIGVNGTSNVAIFNATGANIAGTLDVTGNLTAGNLSGTNITGTLATAAQPNITSVGTLSSLSVTGNVSTGNISGTNITGTLATAAQPNITSVGTLTSLDVTGNVSGGNLTTVSLVSGGTVKGGNITVSGDTISSTESTITIDPSAAGVTGLVVIAGNLQVQGTTTTIDSTTVTINDLMINVANNAATASQANGGGLGVGPVGGEYAKFTYNQVGNAWTSDIAIEATGNISGGNLITLGTVSATGNVSGNYIIGNGSQLTGIVTGPQTSIVNGTSNVAIAVTNGNVTVGVAGVSNVAVFSASGLAVTGNVSGTDVYKNGVTVLNANDIIDGGTY